MPHLLYIESSPRKTRSASIEVSQAFLKAWQASHPGGTVDVLDVWNTPLPEFDGAALDAKYAGLAGQPLSPEQAAVWAQLKALADRFHRADRLVVSAPMWNYTIPYKLKHLIDVVTQKDLLFSFDERGLNGLLTQCRALLVLARGVEFGNAAGAFSAEIWDDQQRYLRLWLQEIGISEVQCLTVEKTLYGPEADTASRAAAVAAAAALAPGF